MQLSGVAQEIADVIGRDRALYFIGKLPRIYCHARGTSQGERCVLYVPKQITTQHKLVEILGWVDAMKIVKAFGGEILQPGNCSEVYKKFRDASIERMARSGMPRAEIMKVFGVSERHCRRVLQQAKPQEEFKAANDNNALIKLRAENGRPESVKRIKRSRKNSDGVGSGRHYVMG